jgi:serine/threonine protein kinase
MNTTNNDEIEFVDETLLESTSSGSPTTTISSSIFSDSTFSSMSQSGLLNNRYIVKQTIGRGSFGVVSIVVDTKHDDTELALKQIPCEDDNEINKAMQEVWPIRFLQHDNLVQYKSVFVHAVQGVMSRSLCIIMPYYSGGDLHQLIQTRNEYQQRFSESELVNYMNQLLSAVEYLHTKRLIHRDLKPSNIYVSDNEETLNIGDFGLVRELDSSQANTVAGTLRYIAPEILVHKKYGEKADLFSLGCIFLEMICLGLDRIMYVVALTNPNYQLEIKQEILTHGYSESLASLVRDHNFNLTLSGLRNVRVCT